MILKRGDRVGRYEILEPLGKGGMGEVYRAKDSQLGRDVAIKVLPERLSDNAVAQKRFEREARAIATLSHPNILAIHDFGTDQEIHFAVMELLTGETLQERIKDSPMPLRKTLEIAAAVADGIAAAHSKGVIHRDLKPGNIFLTNDDRVKVLDFGLARWSPVLSQDQLTEAPTQSQVTRPDTVMGTVPYMSPEQIRGESLDERSDIFSLGCILYEMLAGKRAFSGNSAADTTAAILKDEPVLPANVPANVQRIVERCLQKNPENRFHSAHDLAFALRDVLEKPHFSYQTISIAVLAIIALLFGWKLLGTLRNSREITSQKIGSLAVLPLKNFSGDPKQEYFADGMTEELIAKLARIASLRVISRTSVMEYKNAHKPLPAIAKELNVDAIVEGSVLQSGNRVRITAQLIHAATDRHLWADSYERDLQDVLSLQKK